MTDEAIDVSVVIVNYNVKHFAEQCLNSVRAAAKHLKIEVFVVDNNSSDNSVDYLEPLFPEVEFIRNTKNLGFGKANNIAFRQSRGRYILVLNPDTLLGEDSLRKLVEYLDVNPLAGIVGPKILTRDGSFDITSKRGLPTPWVSFCRLSGLSRLFPKSRVFGKYDLLYLDPDQPAQVDSLVGSCMMVRREVYDKIGGFDEDYFMYGEDIDWCFRIKKAGWEVHYAPVTKIIHFRGESTRRSNIDRDKAFYGAMHLFVEKHIRRKYPFGAHLLLDLGILIAEWAARIRRMKKLYLWPFIDLIGLFVVLLLGRYIRWGHVGLTGEVAFSLTLEAAIWTACLTGFGAYGSKRGQILPLLTAMVAGLLVNSSFTYFFKQFAYSRFVSLFGVTVGSLFVIGWRMILKMLSHAKQWRKFYNRRTLIVGVGRVAQAVINKLSLEKELPYLVVGLVDPDEAAVGSLILDKPVLGSIAELDRLIKQEEIEEVLFANDEIDYMNILETVNTIGKKRGISFKVISPDNLNQPDGVIPLLSLEYLSPRGLAQTLRKITTLAQRH